MEVKDKATGEVSLVDYIVTKDEVYYDIIILSLFIYYDYYLV